MRRSSASPVAAAFLLCLGLAACAEKQPDAWLKDKAEIVHAIQQLNDRQGTLAGEVRDLEKNMQSADGTRNQIAANARDMESRIRKIERESIKQTAELAALNAGMNQLQVSTARLRTRTSRLKKSRQVTKRVLTRKINKIANAIKPAPRAATAIQPVEEEKNHYTAAYLALKSGRYDEAVKGFRKLLSAYPKGEYADQAWYWLGEGLYAEHQPKQALAAFRRVAIHYPKSAKHAAALHKLGLLYQQMSRSRDAKAVLQQLIREYPDSAEADQARAMLKPASDHRQKPGNKPD